MTPSQVAHLENQIAALEAFDRNCLQRYYVHLTENPDGVMVWGYGGVTPHAARFYGIPDTAVPKPYC